MASDAWQRIPPEYAFLREFSPKELEAWLHDHATLSSNQREAAINHEAEPG